MPFIHIKSLPPQTDFNIVDAVESISKTFSKETGIAIEHITATWEFFDSGHYAFGGKTTMYQPVQSHPIIVDLLAPDFHDKASVERMLNCLALMVAEQIKVTKGNVFINYRQAHSGQVFDKGKVVYWRNEVPA